VSAQDEPDEYTTDVFRWWHLSSPSPELLAAVDEGLIAPPGRVLDLGCGLGVELAELASRGFEAVGVDVSSEAIARARQLHSRVDFQVADVLSLPFQSDSFDVLLDRGCFHYIAEPDRRRYETEAWRVLRPGGRFLLRACLTSGGKRNDLPDDVTGSYFSRWQVLADRRQAIPSDTRSMQAVVAVLEKPGLESPG
jgi:SAM-dependent methyltransferase